MSPLIDINFDEVPDEFIPLPVGIYHLEISEVPQVEPTKGGDGMKLVVRTKVVEQISPEASVEFAGRDQVAHMSLKGQIQIKRLALSAGIEVGAKGFDTEDLAGKVVTAQLVQTVVKDQQTGADRIFTNISDFLFKDEGIEEVEESEEI